MITAIGMALGLLTMQSLDGHPVTMDNYGSRAGTALVFLSSRCPVTIENIEVINAQFEESRHAGILFVGLCANDAESSEELAALIRARAIRFPLYRDPGGLIAKQLGVSATPEALLANDKGVVVYRGGFAPAAAQKRFKRAMGDLLANNKQLWPSHPFKGTPISEPGKPLALQDPFGVPHFASELVFEQIPDAPVHHCSTITETASGALLVTWYGGAYESADNQVLFIARRAAGSRDWSAPSVLLRGEFLHPPGNAIIFRMPSSPRIGLLWGRMDAARPIRRGAGWSECQLLFRYSDDDGQTWSADRELPEMSGVLPRNAPIILNDGTLAVPMSGEREGAFGGFLLCTRDNGSTWTRSGFIKGGSQPTVIQRSDGSLLALLRSEPKILRSESFDQGKTWTPIKKTNIRCPESGIAMTRLANGHLLLVFNNSPNDDRTPLNIIRSTDEGRTWSDLRTVEADWGEYSYPCIIQDDRGTVHLTYTFRRYAIKHVEFNEDWYTHLLRPN